MWFIDNNFYLGHDKPQYLISDNYLVNKKLWCHAKNFDALLEMLKNPNIHCFWHENDKVTITSHKHIWSYPTEKFEPKTIAVLPELYNSIVEGCDGVCSDYIINYK